MINKLPNEILLNITLYLNKSEDLEYFLFALDKEHQLDEISRYILICYIKKLHKYYLDMTNSYYNEEHNAFYFYQYLTDIINKKIKYEDIPYDNTDGITSLCSHMIKEYNFIMEYPLHKDIISSIKSITNTVILEYNENKDITFLKFVGA